MHYLIKIKMIDEDKLAEFNKLLKTSSIRGKDKKALEFAIEFLNGKHKINLSSKSFLLKGEPGVGKTFLVESFLNVFDLPIIYAGCAHISHKNIILCENLEKVLAEIENRARFIVFIDDLNFIFKYSEYEEISSHERQLFMKIVDNIKSYKSRVVLFITANDPYCLSDSILDRIDIKIDVDMPADAPKMSFIQNFYSNSLSSKQISYLVKTSLGYNFRDLPEVIKIAYREGKGAISMRNLRNAIKEYVPTSMQRYEVINNSKLNFSHIIGKEGIKNELANVITSFKRKNFARRLGLKRHNLLVFDGPVGTGKTFMVKALAGELKFPIVNIKASHFLSYGPGKCLGSLDSLSKRFQNCIIFVDEAEKMIGRHSMDEDSNFDGCLNDIFDGISGVTNALVIIAVNNLARFGAGLPDRFVRLNFELPNHAERKEFCTRMICKAEKYFRVSIDFDEVARLTEGMSFRDLEKICNNVFYRVLQGQKFITTRVFNDAIRYIKPLNEMAWIYG